MAGKRAASKENQHPVVKKIKADTPKRGSFGRPKTEVTDHTPKLRYNTGPGVVLTAGQGDVGQLGLGPDVTERKQFALVPDLDDVVEIAAGGMHTMCLTQDGKVYTWGCNDEGTLGREAEGDSETIPQVVQLPKKAVQISAGDSHSLALLEDGTVYAWGAFRDSHGSWGLKGEGVQKVPLLMESNGKPLSNIIKICSGADHCIMLTSKGTIYSAGSPEQGQLGRVAQRFASRNARHGMNCLDPAELFISRKKIDNIFAGVYNTFLTSNKETLAFGLNNYSQLGEADANKGDEGSNTCFFKPRHIDSLSNIQWTALATGQHHSLALDVDGQIYCFGRHDYGRLGLKDVNETVTKPTRIPALQEKKIKFIACGNCVSFAIDDSGVLYGWGMGDGYQLGYGKDEDLLEPLKIEGKQLVNYTVLQVASGGQHSVVLARPKNAETTEKKEAKASSSKEKETKKNAAKKETKKDTIEEDEKMSEDVKDVSESEKDVTEGEKDVSEGEKDVSQGDKDMSEGDKDMSEEDKNMTEGNKDKSEDLEEKSDEVKDKSEDSKDKSEDSKDKSEDSKDKSEDSKDKSEDSKDKSEDASMEIEKDEEKMDE